MDMTQESVEKSQLPSRDSDRLLVQACLDGDESAWERLVCTYARRIFNYCLRFTPRRDEAEDMTQEIFVRIYRNLGSFRLDSGNFRLWILSLARNLVVDHYRQERRFHTWLGSEELERMQLEDQRTPDPYHAYNRLEASRRLSLALDALSPDLREAVKLRDLEGMSYQQVAETTGVSEGTVKSRLFRARVRLAKTLSRNSNSDRRFTGFCVNGQMASAMGAC